MTTLINDLNQADRTFHSLAQLIALTGTNQLIIQTDDSQANSIWNSDQDRLEGHPFEYMNQQLRFVIDLPTFSLQFLDEQNNPVATFGAESKTPTETTEWWRAVLHSWGFDPTKPLNYQLEVAPVVLDTKYSRPAKQNEWANWRTIANQALADLNHLSSRTSTIRIWPHHFDTGVYYSIPDEQGKEQAAIWAGYSIADAVSPEPYFYLSGYSTLHPIDFTKAAKLAVGQWLARPDWQGACLPISHIAEAEQITQFLADSYAWINGKADAV